MGRIVWFTPGLVAAGAGAAAAPVIAVGAGVVATVGGIAYWLGRRKRK